MEGQTWSTGGAMGIGHFVMHLNVFSKIFVTKAYASLFKEKLLSKFIVPCIRYFAAFITRSD